MLDAIESSKQDPEHPVPKKSDAFDIKINQNESEAQKSLNEVIDFIKQTLVVSRWLVLAVGVMLIAFYCWREGIMPDGFSVGDAFFIFFVVIVFGVSSLIGVAVGAYMSFWVAYWGTNCRKRKLKGKLQDRGLAVVSLIVCILFLLIASTEHPSARAYMVILFFMCYGCLLILIFGVEHNLGAQASKRGKSMTLFVRVGIAVAPLLLAPFLLSQFQDRVMQWVGIESSLNQMIVVDDEDHKRFADLASAGKIKILFCELPQSGQWFTTTSAQARWHGVGATSYIRLLDQDSKGQKNMLVPISRNNLTVIKPSAGMVFPCSSHS